MMKNAMKNLLAIVLAATICLTLCPLSLASASSTALYSTYTNHMLFQQNEDVIIAGTGIAGEQITCSLLCDSEQIDSAAATVGQDGKFSVKLDGQPGSYKKYSIESSANGTRFSLLEDVVFGELWLASGQSNMQLELTFSEVGMEMQNKGEKGSEWTRFLAAPVLPEYEGSDKNIPLNPLDDINGAFWHDGKDDNIFNISAVAFFFAQKLQKELDVPVGILSVAIGGSSIYTWISREAIDADAAVKNDLQSMNRYIETENWVTAEQNTYIDMTANFNRKIAPLANFRPAGMIWYQGEADIYNPYGAYTRAFALMQSSYTEFFAHPEDEPMPMIFTQLASYGYNTLKELPLFNVELSEIQAASPNTRAMTSIHDVPLTYFESSHAIHPICKKPVGEKMCYAAMGLVYGAPNDYTAATPDTCVTDGNKLLITFKNVGDGLAVNGSILYGFTLCGEDGIYLPADAQIVSPNTVSVSCESIAQPVSAAYACSLTNCRANLFATENNTRTLAVSPFVTSRDVSKHYWQDSPWMQCDSDKVWRVHKNAKTGYYDTWQGSTNTEISFDGGNMLVNATLKSLKNTFTVKPVLRFDENQFKTKAHYDFDKDWTDYNTLSFSVKNDGESEITLENAKLYVNSVKWYAPAVNDTELANFSIPSDGQWHKVTLNLDTIYPYGKEYLPDYSRAELGEMFDFELCFGGQKGDAKMSLDNFAFTASGTEGAPCDNLANAQNATNIFEKMLCGVINFFAFFINLF